MMIDSDDLRARLSGLAPPSIIGVGDNVLDCYLDEDVAFPGGNALNVAVYGRLFFGGTSGYLGIVGADRFAEHLRDTLDRIGVEHGQCRTVAGPNGMAFVELRDGDRRFVGSNRGGVQAGLRLRMTPDDHEHLAGYAVVHTSTYSALDTELAVIAERSEISYDFSTDRAPALLERVGPSVTLGFFSGDGLDDAGVDRLGRLAVDCGIDTTVVTRGARGARAFRLDTTASTPVLPVAAVDTLGAGDAFIAGYLAAHQDGGDLDRCLKVGATAGALACTQRGAFGYPVAAGPDAVAQFTRRIGDD